MASVWGSRGARYAIVGLSLVVVFSIVSPAVGGPNPVKIAKKALNQSKKANKKAKKANRAAKDASAQNVSAHDSVLAFGAVNAAGEKVAEVELTTTGETTILASASTVVGNDPDDLAICWLNDGGDPANTANDMGQRVFSDARNGLADFQALSLNGAVEARRNPQGASLLRRFGR